MDIVMRDLGDELEPAQILFVCQPQVGLEAIVVVDNVACVDQRSVAYAWLQTSRSRKSLVWHGPRHSRTPPQACHTVVAKPASLPTRTACRGRKTLIRTFARLICELTAYIPGPAMGTNDVCMAWIKDEINRAVGLPRVVDRLETPLGLCLRAALTCHAAATSPEAQFAAYPEKRGMLPHFTVLRIGILFDCT